MCERMQWCDSKRSFLTAMNTGTNFIYIFLSRPKDQKLGKVLIEGLRVGMVCKRIVWLMEQCFLFNVNADYWHNRVVFLSAISFWSDNHSVNYVRLPFLKYLRLLCSSLPSTWLSKPRIIRFLHSLHSLYPIPNPVSYASILTPLQNTALAFTWTTHIRNMRDWSPNLP